MAQMTLRFLIDDTTYSLINVLLERKLQQLVEEFTEF